MSFSQDAHDALYAVDEVRRRGLRWARIARIDPDGGGFDLLAEWPRLWPGTRYALASGNEGELYLAGSRDTVFHFVVRLLPNGTSVRALGWAFGAGGVVPHQARVGERGLTLYVVDRNDVPTGLAYGRQQFVSVVRGWESMCF